jgi:hypothetical protein
MIHNLNKLKYSHICLLIDFVVVNFNLSLQGKQQSQQSAIRFGIKIKKIVIGKKKNSNINMINTIQNEKN